MADAIAISDLCHMRKDIHAPKVEGVAMAVVRETDPEGEPAWYVYLINQREEELENVLVSSRGYGELGGEARKTSEMRHFLDKLGPKSWARIERESPRVAQTHLPDPSRTRIRVIDEGIVLRCDERRIGRSTRAIRKEGDIESQDLPGDLGGDGGLHRFEGARSIVL